MTSVNFAQLLQEYGAGTEVVPDGPYDVAVAGAKVSASRTNPPKYMIVARLRILTGPYANKVLMHNFVLTPDNPNAMYHWFRNFSILGIGSEYFNTTADMSQVLQQVAAALEGRQAHVEAETTGARQNVNFMAATAGVPGAVPMPPTPQPAPGMQPQFGTPQFQQGPPGQPAFQQPQPSVAPPIAPGPMVQPPLAPAAQQAPGMPPQGVGGFPAPPNPAQPGVGGGYSAPPNGPMPAGPPGQPLNVPGAPGYPPQAAPQPAPAPAPAPPGPGFPAPPAQPAAPAGPGVQPGVPQAAPQQYPAPPAGTPEQQQVPQGFPAPASPPPQVPV